MTDTIAPPTGEDEKDSFKGADKVKALAEDLTAEDNPFATKAPEDSTPADSDDSLAFTRHRPEAASPATDAGEQVPVNVVEQAQSPNVDIGLRNDFLNATKSAKTETEFRQQITGQLKEVAGRLGMREEQIFTIDDQGDLYVHLEGPFYDRLYDAYQLAQAEFDMRNEELAEGFRARLAKARSLEELREVGRDYIANPQDDPESQRHYLQETEDGWLEPISPDDTRAAILMTELNQARENLEKRSAIKRARDRISLHADKREVRKQDRAEDRAHHKAEKKTRKENAAQERMDRIREEAQQDVDAKHEEAIQEEIKARVEEAKEFVKNQKQEEFFKDLVDEVAYRDEKIAKTRDPIEAQMKELQQRQTAIDRMPDSPLLDKQALKQSFIDQEKALRKRYEKAPEEVDQIIAEKQQKLNEIMTGQVDSLITFKAAEAPEPHIYAPTADENQEVVTLVARLNGNMLKREEEPFQIDEYDLGKTRMQRFVYKTADPNIVIVEEWDKTAGKLKRQAVLKGDKLLVPEYENNPRLGRIRREIQKSRENTPDVLSNEAYKSIGLMNGVDLVADSGTSYSEGRPNYIRNLARSGLGFESAKRYSSGLYKPKNDKGFIALLQEEWAKNKAKAA